MVGMEHPDERVRLRAQEDRELFAIRRTERHLVAEELELEQGIEAFGEVEDRVELEIETEWQREHWGKEPERPPSWRTDRDRS